MPRTRFFFAPLRLCVSFWILCAPASAVAQTTPSVAAVVETTLKTAVSNIRQYAFDGKPDTYFASSQNPTKADHFTLVFDKPVTVRSVTVTTGKPKGGDELKSGALEGSEDGKIFVELTKFADGVARAKPDGKKLKAIRIKPDDDLKHSLAIREFEIDSEPRVAVFKYPIEFSVDVSDAPEMKEWADIVARICERNYTMINEELFSEGFKPRTQITMTLKKDYKGVAAAGGGKITGSVKYFKSRPDDIGAMIHETVHCVQAYRTRPPGWLVEGIADYIRFFKYEPGKIGKIKADPHYDGSYRTSAAFLNFVTEKHDKELVRKINKALREGEYREELWKTLTKKTLKELDEDWRASLTKGAVDERLMIEQEKKPEDGEKAVIYMKSIRAATMALLLKSTFALPKDMGPFIEVYYEQNAIRVRGTKEQVGAVREEIGRIEKLIASGNNGPPKVKLYDVPKGSAEAIVKVLSKHYNDVTIKIAVVNPGRIFVYADGMAQLEIANQVTFLADAFEIWQSKDEPKKAEPKKESKTPTGPAEGRGPQNVPPPAPTLPPNVRILHVDDGHAETVAEAMRMIFPILYADEKSIPRITIVAAADSVVVLSDDAKVLSHAVELVRLIQADVPQCDYEVIALKHAKAVDIVKIVNEIYNSKKNDKGERVERVRVIADAESNAVLVRGRELERLAIRNLVTKYLDVPRE